MSNTLWDIHDERTRQELRDFINVGLRDVQRGALNDFDETFDRIEKRYRSEKFDYTKWQRKYFDAMPSGEFQRQALEYAKAHPYTGEAERL